jgi:hypothetical protein
MRLKTVDKLLGSKSESSPCWYKDLATVRKLLLKENRRMGIPAIQKATGLGYGHLTTILAYPVSENKFGIHQIGGNYTKMGRKAFWVNKDE